MNSFVTRSVCLGLLLATPALAQNQFGPLGNQIMDGSQNLVTVNLGFSFTMPGGAVVTSLDVDEHGRLVEVGSDASDSSETTGEMTANPTGSINVLWDFNGFTAPNAGVYFFTDNASFATFTWTQITFTGAPCNYQCQLFGDGRIVMVYDSNCPADDGIIGVCPGNGAVLPAQSNLDDAITTPPLLSTDPTVFEDFGFTAGVDAFDMPSSALEFIPMSTGGATGWTVVGNAGVIDPILPFASNEEAGGGDCTPSAFTPFTLLWTPDGQGGYDATSTAIAFDSNIGPDAGLTGDDEALGGFDLGFVFPWPDGTSSQFAKIDSNGRVGPDVAAFTSDFSPSLTEFHNDGHAVIAALWTDINITVANSGKIHFNTVPGASATFTWDAVTQFGSTQPITFQVTLYANGLIQFNLQDLLNYNLHGSGADDTIIGTSTGVGPDPGEIDITALGTANNGATTYEYWDSSGAAPVEPCDLNDLTANYGDLAALTTPKMGTNWDLEIQNVPTQTTLGFYVIGLAAQNLDVTAFGSPCTLVPTSDLLELTLPSATAGVMNQLNFPIPNQANLLGFELFVQGIHDGAPAPVFTPFVGLPWSFVFTNAIKGTIGTI